MTQRLVLAYKGEKISQTIIFVEGFTFFRCNLLKWLRLLQHEDTWPFLFGLIWAARTHTQKKSLGGHIPGKCANCRLVDLKQYAYITQKTRKRHCRKPTRCPLLSEHHPTSRQNSLNFESIHVAKHIAPQQRVLSSSMMQERIEPQFQEKML